MAFIFLLFFSPAVWRIAVNHIIFIMRCSYFIVLYILMPLCAISQRTQKDRAAIDLKGPVKEMILRSYAAVDNFGKLSKGERINENGSYLFNAAGNLLEQNIYNKNGSLRARHTYNYDKAGQLQEQHIFNPGGGMRTKLRYRYNADGLLQEQLLYLPDGKLQSKYLYGYQQQLQTGYSWYNADGGLEERAVYNYNDKGNQISLVSYSNADSILQQLQWHYDEQGNIVAQTAFENNHITETITYAYDAKGLTTLVLVKNEAGISTRHIRYQYDAAGRLIQETWLDAEEKELDNYTSKYETDRQQNWVKKTTWRNGVPVSVTERDLYYFKIKK
jgi:YD repeat-containing protein